jgi:hypothetical protein
MKTKHLYVVYVERDHCPHDVRVFLTKTEAEAWVREHAEGILVKNEGRNALEQNEDNELFEKVAEWGEQVWLFIVTPSEDDCCDWIVDWTIQSKLAIAATE